ncbi:MAG TPA: plastocyanin/azurin family copper-binding protein [Solirubrobacter sp.]|nr:plastocyanin/azurin family copper-binding protein [Solirubrobacter sp.]
MRRRLVAAAAFALLALPSAAHADVTIQAVDGTATDGSDNRWAPAVVDIEVGQSVTWSFAGTTLVHNVRGVNFTHATTPAIAGPPSTYTFTQAGTYEFYCELHAQSMRGTVRVGNPPPPPPPPLSEQPFPNDAPAPTVLEVLDETAPRVSAVRVSRVKRGARVRFRMSEAGRVTIMLKRGKRTVKSRHIHARAGTNAVTVRGVPAGRYRVEISARDESGNRARLRRARVTLRG